MAKKPAAATKPQKAVKPAEQVAPALQPVLAEPIPQETRAPRGRANRATPKPLDATPPPAVPAGSGSLDPAAVTAPPKRKGAKVAENGATPRGGSVKKTVSAAEEVATKVRAQGQKAADSLLKIASKAVKAVGEKAARLKDEASEKAAEGTRSRSRLAAKPPAAVITPAPAAPTQEEIAIRAYLIAEKRQQHGIHAEPHEDWIEAERQLHAETHGGTPQ